MNVHGRSLYFEGTKYGYKVVDGNGNMVRGITVLENLAPNSQTREMPEAWSAAAPNGQFGDLVGRGSTNGTFSPNYFNSDDQTFVVTWHGVSMVLSTTVRQTVSSDSNGNVTAVAHTIVP